MTQIDADEGKKKRYLVTVEGCGACEELKQNKDIKEELESGKLVEVHCSDNEGDEQGYRNFIEAVENGITAFPTEIEVSRKGETLRVCEVSPEGDAFKCRKFKSLSDEEFKEMLEQDEDEEV